MDENRVELPIKKIRTPLSLSDMAYTTIKESIHRLYAEGMPSDGRIEERDLAEKLGISRTPLREAINRLVAEGVLNVVPRKGIFVVKKSKREIIEILHVRTALEGMAARLATGSVRDKEIRLLRDLFLPFKPSTIKDNIDKYAAVNVKFHESILNFSGCGKLIEVAEKLSEQMRLIRLQTISFGERAGKSYEEHLLIIDAMEDRDATLAERRMRGHIWGIITHLEKHGDPAFDILNDE